MKRAFMLLPVALTMVCSSCSPAQKPNTDLKLDSFMGFRFGEKFDADSKLEKPWRVFDRCMLAGISGKLTSIAIASDPSKKDSYTHGWDKERLDDEAEKVARLLEDKYSIKMHCHPIGEI